MRPFAHVVFDGTRLSLDPRAPGRRLRIDARCVEGEPVPGAYAHVCALPEKTAALRYDEPEVQQVRRDALAWWIPMLGDDLVCLSTFALDASRCAGAITVARHPERFADDPFARQSAVDKAVDHAFLSAVRDGADPAEGKASRGKGSRKRLQRASRPGVPKTFGSRSR